MAAESSGAVPACLEGKGPGERAAILHQHLGRREMTDIIIETIQPRAGTGPGGKFGGRKAGVPTLVAIGGDGTEGGVGWMAPGSFWWCPATGRGADGHEVEPGECQADFESGRARTAQGGGRVSSGGTQNLLGCFPVQSAVGPLL